MYYCPPPVISRWFVSSLFVVSWCLRIVFVLCFSVRGIAVFVL